MAENESAPKSVTIIRRSLLSASVAGGRCVSRVEVKQIDLQLGQCTGYHLHAIPVIGFIARGSIRFQIEGAPVQILPAGSAFFEPTNARVRHFDNASDQEPATFIAYYLLGEHDEQLIEMLE